MNNNSTNKIGKKRVAFIMAALVISAAAVLAYLWFLIPGLNCNTSSCRGIDSTDINNADKNNREACSLHACVERIGENVKSIDTDLLTQETVKDDTEDEDADDPLLDDEIKKTSDELKERYEAKERAKIMKHIRKLRPLKNKIRKEIRGKEGNWSVYIKNLTSGESISINNKPQRSASLIKLYTAGTYLRAVKHGVIKDTPDNAYDFEYMIKESSNDAWKGLEAKLGDAYNSDQQSVVNNFIGAYGFSDTHRDRYSLHGSTTSVNDTGRLLEMAYKGKYVSKKASARLIKYMKMQDHRRKIPAGLPKGVLCANKTGELDTVDNDAAIIWTEYQDYILVVMADETNMHFYAAPEIAKISKMVYRYITGV